MQSGPLLRPTLPFLARGGFRILLLRTLDEKPMHGYEVMKALEARFQGFYRPSAGAVYPALRSLQREGLVAVTGSERRKTYRLTAKGKASIRRHRLEMEKHFQSLQAAVGPERAALLRELRDTGKLLATNLRSLTPRQAVELRSAVVEMRKRIVTILGESSEGDPHE
jgi:DNA-binding PadR family transcriptional regulator